MQRPRTDDVFVSVAKKRCFLGAFEIQSEKRSPRRGGVGFAARRKNKTTTSFAIIPEEEVEELSEVDTDAEIDDNVEEEIVSDTEFNFNIDILKLNQSMIPVYLSTST